MISIKRDKKTGKKIKANGILGKSHQYLKYKPNQKEDFKLSRSRFDEFMSCQKCFYLRLVIGLQPPNVPGWTLNTLTDTLLKKEFDECRDKQVSHRMLIKENLGHIVPFETKIIEDEKGREKQRIEIWRDSRHAGLKYRYKKTNIILQGGVDDVWFNTKTKELIIADYKSQHDTNEVTKENYFNKPHKEGYKRQLDFYAYLLKGMKFLVAREKYIYLVNAKEKEGFNGEMKFDEIIIPYVSDPEYLEAHIDEMIKVINSKEIPKPDESCENCAYSAQFNNL
tara:strand:- start:364 stop:1206 length:843 start_codon:yes stop_codon:yes gene_type:complete